MKLKTLLIVVGLLALLSGIVFVARRPAPPAATDPRVGQPLVSANELERTTRLRVTDAGQTVELVRVGEGEWRVASFHQLPADFGKLSRFVRDLTESKLERLVTRNPEMLARLQFGGASIELSDASGQAVTTLQLGRNADGGGRFVRFGDEPQAYLTRLTAWLDTTSRNWTSSSLVAVKPEQVARLEFTWADGSAFVVTRPQAEAPFASDALPPGQALRQATLNTVLSSLTSLRFTDTAAPDAPDAQAARQHLQTIRLTTFDGATVVVAAGRKPEQRITQAATPGEADGPANVVKAGADAAGPSAVEPATETVPAGPAFVWVTGDAKLAPLAGAMEHVSFKVSDFVLTSLPKSPAELTEAAVQEAPPGSAESAPAPAP